MKIERVDVTTQNVDIDAAFNISTRISKPGPPQRVAGMTLGIVEMTSNAPHGGEVHPDGDEFLHVISGRVEVTGDSSPAGIVLKAGDSCIVRANEWHKVNVLEPTRLLHITPGPHGDHRPLPTEAE